MFCIKVRTLNSRKNSNVNLINEIPLAVLSTKHTTFRPTSSGDYLYVNTEANAVEDRKKVAWNVEDQDPE